MELSRYGRVPAALLHHSDLGVDEIGLLAALTTYADRQGCCRLSQATLAKGLKRSRPWVIKVMNKLVKLGLLEREARFDRHGGQRANQYRLCFTTLTSEDASETYPKSNEMGGLEGDGGCHGGDTTQTHSLSGIDSLSQAGERDSFRKPFERQTCDVEAKTGELWRPSDQDMLWASETYPDIDAALLTKQFTDAVAALSYRYTNPQAAWRSWFANQARWRSENENRDGKRKAPARKLEPSDCRNIPAVPSLSDRNDAVADSCLERILSRRARLHDPREGGGFR